MQTIFIALTGLLIVTVIWFWGFCFGQSRLRKMNRIKLKKILLDIDEINSANGSIKAYIKPIIDKIIMAELKECIRYRKAWKR